MIIKKSSWHYSFIKATEAIMPESLCDYWYAVFRNLFMIVFGFLIFVAFTFMMGIASLSYFFETSASEIGWWGYLLAVGIGILIIVLLFVCIGIAVCISEFFQKSESSLVVYAKNKHAKVCTKIEYKD